MQNVHIVYGKYGAGMIWGYEDEKDMIALLKKPDSTGEIYLLGELDSLNRGLLCRDQKFYLAHSFIFFPPEV